MISIPIFLPEKETLLLLVPPPIQLHLKARFHAGNFFTAVAPEAIVMSVDTMFLFRFGYHCFAQKHNIKCQHSTRQEEDGEEDEVNVLIHMRLCSCFMFHVTNARFENLLKVSLEVKCKWSSGNGGRCVPLPHNKEEKTSSVHFKHL